MPDFQNFSITDLADVTATVPRFQINVQVKDSQTQQTLFDFTGANALVFPGLGLGVTVARTTRITHSMITAAAQAVAELSNATSSGASLLPPVTDLRTVSAAVAIAVAEAAVAEGLAQLPLDNPIQQIHQAMWRPEYPRVETKPL